MRCCPAAAWLQTEKEHDKLFSLLDMHDSTLTLCSTFLKIYDRVAIVYKSFKENDIVSFLSCECKVS
jgi:hypothetical protein